MVGKLAFQSLGCHTLNLKEERCNLASGSRGFNPLFIGSKEETPGQKGDIEPSCSIGGSLEAEQGKSKQEAKKRRGQ